MTSVTEVFLHMDVAFEIPIVPSHDALAIEDIIK